MSRAPTVSSLQARSRDLYYKIYNCCCIVISQSVCHSHLLPPYSNISGPSQEPTVRLKFTNFNRLQPYPQILAQVGREWRRQTLQLITIKQAFVAVFRIERKSTCQGQALQLILHQSQKQIQKCLTTMTPISIRKIHTHPLTYTHLNTRK